MRKGNVKIESRAWPSIKKLSGKSKEKKRRKIIRQVLFVEINHLFLMQIGFPFKAMLLIGLCLGLYKFSYLQKLSIKKKNPQERSIREMKIGNIIRNPAQ